MSGNSTEPGKKSNLIELRINGQAIKARPGQTVLEVVHEQGLDQIPNLCNDPKLEPFGSCFLCVVEVKGARGLVPSCITRVRENMEVTTNSDKIQCARKTALDLLLSDHFADCLCPAQTNCPAGVDVQGYLSLANLGFYDQALRLIKETNPLPVVCGRVCVRRCEVNCRRNIVDEAVGINYVKRFVAEKTDREKLLPPKKAPTGKRVAVIGGGPAGLTAAYYLSLMGHSVKIFEAMSALGGMLRWGIPEYRLPKSELDQEIAEILSLGVEVELGKKLGKDFTIQSLREQDKFDAVFLAMGAPLGKKMEIPGEDAEGIESALEFLRDSVLKGPRKLYGKVVVVGGGNSAIDAARTALRSGADEVIILYRRTRKEMPAHPEEVEAAVKEGVKLEILAAPVEVIAEKGRLQALKCIRMELGAPDASGRRSPVPIKGSEFEYSCDFVFAAIGQGTDPDPLKKESEGSRPALGRGNTVKADEDLMTTNIPGVFAGGDLVSGPSVVIEAIAHGGCAARSIDQYLKTGEVKKEKKIFVSKREVFGPIPDKVYDEVARSKRQPMPERDPLERKNDFKETELGLAEPGMKEESLRCMECGCKAQFDCRLREYATRYNADQLRLSGAVRRHKVDSSHPLLVLDSNKCILCGRCVRACAQVLDQSVFGFVNRGFSTVVKPAMGRPLAESPCISCGACVETCPTGALSAKLPFRRQGPWKTKKIHSVCGFCSVGCEMDLNVVTDGLLWAGSRATARIGEGDLCYRGRFGTGLVQCGERITKPLVRKNGELVEASWDEAIKTAARILKEAQKKNGPGSTAFLSSARMTLEEAYLAGRMARSGLGTSLIGSFSQFRKGGPRNDLDKMIGATISTCSQSELNSADLILVLGADPSTTHPVLAIRIRRAARKGARVVIINSSNMDLAHSAKLWLNPRRGTAGILLAGVLAGLIEKGAAQPQESEGKEDFESLKKSLTKVSPDQAAKTAGVDGKKLEELAGLIAGAEKMVAIYDLDDTIEQSPEDLKMLAQILILTGHLSGNGNGLLLLRPDCNSEGARLAGILDNHLPGKDQGGLSQALASGKIKSALVMLEDPFCDPQADQALGGLEALVVIDHFLTGTARQAQVVLPASTLAETDGTIISLDRIAKAVNRADHPASGKTSSEVLCLLAAELGHQMPSDPAEIRKELSGLLGIPPEQLEQARQNRKVWPALENFPGPIHLQPVKIEAQAGIPLPYFYASLDGYLQKRLIQLGWFKRPHWGQA